jgi:hypothetical protein
LLCHQGITCWAPGMSPMNRPRHTDNVVHCGAGGRAGGQRLCRIPTSMLHVKCCHTHMITTSTASTNLSATETALPTKLACQGCNCPVLLWGAASHLAQEELAASPLQLITHAAIVPLLWLVAFVTRHLCGSSAGSRADSTENTPAPDNNTAARHHAAPAKPHTTHTPAQAKTCMF